MSIVLNSDFVGKYELTVNQFNIDLIDSYIEKYEDYYLSQLLGASLSSAFISNLTAGVPTNPIYLTIFNPLSYDFNNKVITSNGIKEMLLGFIYYHYVSDSDQIQTSIGTVAPSNENSVGVGLNTLIMSRFNRGLDTMLAIQNYIYENRSTYPTYNGQPVKYAYTL